MSFILDALKKSEAERRQGEIPGLNNQPGPAPPRRRSIWPFLLTAALLLNGVAFGGWLLLRQEKPPLAQTSTGELDRILAARRAVSSMERMPAPPPGEAEPIPLPAAEPRTQSPAEPVRPAASARDESPEVRPAAEFEEVPKDYALAVQETPAAPSTDVSLKTAEPASPAEPVPQLVAVQRPAAPAAAATFPAFSELPGDVRSGLPGLHLQLHFYSTEPARRLVRLNGYNLREGDRGGDGLMVEEITPDGIRLSCRGVRFFLPTARR